jgi:hypothetical protein
MRRRGLFTQLLALNALLAGLIALALAQQFFHHHISVEDRRLAPTLAHDLQATLQKRVGILCAQLEV